MSHSDTLTLLVRRSRLCGTVHLSGAKNSVLRILPATILTNETVVIFNCPVDSGDVRICLEMMCSINKTISIVDETVTILPNSYTPGVARSPTHRSIRSTLLLLAAELGRYGRARAQLPGGCEIGDRGISYYLGILASMGAEIWEEGGYVYASCAEGLRAASIQLLVRSSGLTELALIAATLAKGTTLISGAFCPPETLDLIDFLRKLGAQIVDNGQTLVVRGASELGPATHTAIPDSVEAVMFLIAAAITKGRITIPNFPIAALSTTLYALEKIGLSFAISNNSLTATCEGQPRSFDITVGQHPRILTDTQPFFAALALVASGTSTICDPVWPQRFAYAAEIRRLGASAIVLGSILSVSGARQLRGVTVTAPDIRGGAALALAALTSSGTTVIRDCYQIARGYHQFTKKLRALGANIEETYGTDQRHSVTPLLYPSNL